MRDATNEGKTAIAGPNALPGAALADLVLRADLPGTLLLLLLAALSRILAAGFTRRAEDIFAADLPRAAAADVAPAVARAGVRTLVFGHSHTADHARFGNVEYYNTGTWVRAIEPLSLVPRPHQTYLLVDDAENGGRAQLLQWTDRGPQEPIIVRRD